MFKIFDTATKQTVAAGLSLNEARHYCKNGKSFIFLPM